MSHDATLSQQKLEELVPVDKNVLMGLDPVKNGWALSGLEKIGVRVVPSQQWTSLNSPRSEKNPNGRLDITVRTISSLKDQLPLAKNEYYPIEIAYLEKALELLERAKPGDPVVDAIRSLDDAARVVFLRNVLFKDPNGLRVYSFWNGEHLFLDPTDMAYRPVRLLISMYGEISTALAGAPTSNSAAVEVDNEKGVLVGRDVGASELLEPLAQVVLDEARATNAP